ncbi:hypothetical protein ANN_10860 [Periplaneta americana]|uniref:Carboxylesterase type B domain-containing protein n=1 Tax=Periplaneta americana TaxID=6978 RepID=A0ABQ8T3E8_PERAM|nr:hypothetical protein ANN_10860 [Periplaneta americana]
MATLWTNFATYGDPTPLSNATGVTWEPFSGITHSYLNFSQEEALYTEVHGVRPLKLSMERELYMDRMQFWDSLPLRENEIYYTTRKRIR